MDNPTRPKLVFEKGPLPDQEVVLTKEEIVIGRDPDVDLVIPSPMVSRRHARVFRQNGQYLVEDLGSTNKTYLNGRELESAQPLKTGDIVRLGGSVQVTYVGPVEDERTQAHRIAGGTGQAETLLGDRSPVQLRQPPLLIVTVSGREPQAFTLTQDLIRLGRSADNDIVIPSPVVSARHAVLEKRAHGYVLKLEPHTTNPMHFQGAPIRAEHELHDGDILRMGGVDPGLMVTFFYQWPDEAALKGMTQHIEFGDKDQLQIGREPGNDIVLDAPIVSRYHATVERVGQRFRVRDLNSANGTFVNDRRIEQETWLKPGDSLRIGPTRFVLGEDQLTRFDETAGLRVEALGLNKWVRKDLNLLKDISLLFQPREFIVVVGQSGGGKSTLVDAIAGYRPATHGRVLVNGIDIYRHFDAIRNEIGFVPQKDIIHTELTVFQALDYAAQLRMPSDTTKEERHRRVMEVLADLDLVHRKDMQISGLSGGQQKRVSIGVELLTKPGLFFLDEPTSGLDPGTETALMHLMRRLADQGRTIVLITHATKNVMLADKVLFLARGGYVAWFGPPDEALRFFDQYRTERERRTQTMEFDQIYAVLDDPAKGKAEEWAARYQASAAYQQYIVQPLAALGRAVQESALPPGRVEPAPSRGKALLPAGKKRVSGLRQFAILSSRNVKILTRDRVSLVLMLASAPLLAMLTVVLSLVKGRDLFSYADGNMGDAITSLFLPGFIAILAGALAVMREFVKESEIYKRERLVNLRVLPYVLSKLWVAALLALYQALIYTGVHYLAFEMPGGAVEFVIMYVTLLLATLAGMALGLLASAVAPNANAAPLLVMLLIIPEVVLGGGLFPMPTSVSLPSSARWSFEAVMSATGAGSDVAADPCWGLDEDVRDALSLSDKEARGCTCMGLNALNPESCSFPGLGTYYTAALDEPEPAAPAAIGDPPPEPALPAAPVPPADQSDSAAMAKFLQDLDAYQKQVDQIQTSYRADLQDFQARSDTFKAEAETYQEALATWNIERSSAVSRAEALIETFHKDYGWTFVDKEDGQAYWSKILIAWGAQALIITILFSVILFTISQKA